MDGPRIPHWRGGGLPAATVGEAEHPERAERGMAQALKVGIPTSIISESPTLRFAAMFEDDGDTGYLYAMEVAQREIVDALPIRLPELPAIRRVAN